MWWNRVMAGKGGTSWRGGVGPNRARRMGVWRHKVMAGKGGTSEARSQRTYSVKQWSGRSCHGGRIGKRDEPMDSRGLRTDPAEGCSHKARGWR